MGKLVKPPITRTPDPEPKPKTNPLVPAWPVHGMQRKDFVEILRSHTGAEFKRAADEFSVRPTSSAGWIRLENAMYAYQAVVQFPVDTPSAFRDIEDTLSSLAEAPIGRWVVMLNTYARIREGEL